VGTIETIFPGVSVYGQEHPLYFAISRTLFCYQQKSDDDQEYGYGQRNQQDLADNKERCL
jgi:hypothetical protein